MLGLEGQVIASSVEETVDQVAVSVYQRSVKGEMPGAGVLIDVEVLLREPIGDRTVVDALSGSELRVVRW